jgi:hypothetical protein
MNNPEINNLKKITCSIGIIFKMGVKFCYYINIFYEGDCMILVKAEKGFDKKGLC